MYCSISSTVISATPSLMAYDSIAFRLYISTNTGALSSRCFASSVHISDGKDSFYRLTGCLQIRLEFCNDTLISDSPFTQK